jgi:hypothetical protein
MDHSTVAYGYSPHTPENGSPGLYGSATGRPSRAQPAAGRADGNGGQQRHAGHATEAAREAMKFWRRMELTAPPDGAPRPRSMPLPGELYPVLRLFEAAAAGSRTRGVSVPSAGALYPYEHLVVVSGPNGPVVFAVDVDRRTCQLLRRLTSATTPGVWLGTVPIPGPGFGMVLTVVRPWLSMRKYGHRGYLYAHLDAAHLGSHLLCLASQTHRRATWLTRSRGGPLCDLLQLADRCRFVHSTLLLDDPTEPAVPPRDTWTCTDRREMTPPPSDETEVQCWQRLLDAGWPLPDGDPDLPSDVRWAPLLPGIEDASARVADAAVLAGAAPRRRSAKDFAPGEVGVDAVREALRALMTPLSTDLPATDGFGVTLVARHVAGLVAGAYPVRGGSVASEPSGRCVAADDDLVRICMGQEHLRHASAAVVFHARQHDIFANGISGVDAALLRVGALAHLLYLGATAAGLAVTTIGGFDPGGWHHLGAAEEQDEVLYVALVGNDGADRVKLDRLEPAHAHGGA